MYPTVCPFCREISKNGICNFCQKKISYINEPRCMKCGKPIRSEEQEFCYDCSRFTYAFERGYSLWVHQQPISGAIYQYKFHNKRCYAKIFAEEMAKKYGAWIRDIKIDAIIPVPLHWAKKRQRGFNQAELLAELLSEELVDKEYGTKIPVLRKVLLRIRNTKPQKMLNDLERQSNLKNAFAITASWNPVKTVLLIDDIYTTGVTMQKTAKLLKNAGVEKVYFLTISIGQGL